MMNSLVHLARLHLANLMFLGAVTLWPEAPLMGQCMQQGYSSRYGYTETYRSLSPANYELNRLFTLECARLENFFGVNVDFAYMNDAHSPNAEARCGLGHYDGVVHFGIHLLSDELTQLNRGQDAVVGILAHEYAHILQCKNLCSLHGRERELQADFLAGYYLGNRQWVTFTDIHGFAHSLFDKGDFYDPSHHGTPPERVRAMVAGYESSHMSLNQAYQISMGVGNGGYGENISTQARTQCHTCRGQGQVLSIRSCHACNGQLIYCGGCNGQGSGYNAWGEFVVCSHCRGTGQFTCGTCNGAGKQQRLSECPRCEGSGYH